MKMCHNIHMENRHQAKVIEPEILDEHGLPVAQQTAARSTARSQYRGAGFLTGFFALTFTFIMLLVGALVTVFIIAPVLLLGRVLGLQIKTFRR